MQALSVTEIERVFREEYGRAVAVLVRAFGDGVPHACYMPVKRASSRWACVAARSK